MSIRVSFEDKTHILPCGCTCIALCTMTQKVQWFENASWPSSYHRLLGSALFLTFYYDMTVTERLFFFWFVPSNFLTLTSQNIYRVLARFLYSLASHHSNYLPIYTRHFLKLWWGVNKITNLTGSFKPNQQNLNKSDLSLIQRYWSNPTK